MAIFETTLFHFRLFYFSRIDVQIVLSPSKYSNICVWSASLDLSILIGALNVNAHQSGTNWSVWYFSWNKKMLRQTFCKIGACISFEKRALIQSSKFRSANWIERNRKENIKKSIYEYFLGIFFSSSSSHVEIENETTKSCIFTRFTWNCTRKSVDEKSKK